MDNNNTKDTITSFFKNKIPRNAQLHFQHWLLKKENANEKNEVLNQLWEEVELLADQSTYKDLQEIHRRIKYLDRKSKPFYISMLRVAAILLLPVLVFTATYFYFKANTSNMEVVQYYVPKGEVKHLLLSDGTEVWINSDSYFSLPKKITSGKRVVNLTGEAYFQVTKNTQNPFIVQTNRMNVEVLGTKFNVNAYPDLAEIKTTLKEGSVKVKINDDKNANSFILSPNEELSINTKTGDIAKKTVEATGLPTWSEGDMLFNAVLMPDIFKQMEKRYGIRIACNNSKYEDKRLTVKFENNESINEVFQILQLMVPDLTISKQDSIIYIK